MPNQSPNPSPSPGPSPGPAPFAELLQRLLDRLLDDLAAAGPDLAGPLAVGVLDLDDVGADIAVHPLDDPDPVVALAGWRAPADWRAFGVLARGTTAEHPPRRVRFGILVARDGIEVAAAHLDGDDSGPGEAIPVPGPAQGRVPDACRAVFGG